MKAQIPPSEYKKLSDEEMIFRFFHRQENRAIVYIYERYGHLVMGLCCRYLNSIDEAKEATRQVFLNLLTELSHKEIKEFKPWLYHYVRDFCQLKTSGTKSNSSVKDKSVAFEHNLRQIVEEEKALQQLDNEMSVLNEDVRTCIELFYLRNMTFNQIALQTGKPLREVKMNIRNGKQDLKIKLELTGGARL